VAAASLAMAVADHVRDDACKLDCLDAIVMRPAAAELQDAYEAMRHLPPGIVALDCPPRNLRQDVGPNVKHSDLL
jgi:hypothetical protein